MKRSIRTALACAALCLPLTACYTLTHTVGRGGSGRAVEQARQWYALWGLVPINHVDGGRLAGGAAEYTIRTQASFLDVLINIVTGYVSIVSRTVTVTK